MKKIILFISAVFSIIGAGATIDCTKICVASIAMDNTPEFMNVTIYNGSATYVGHPSVKIIDSNGDTVAKGTVVFFVHLPLSAQTYTIPTTLASVPTNFSATVLFYEYDQLICSLTYPTFCKAVDCNKICVTGVAMDTLPGYVNVTIYNGDTNTIGYPIVKVLGSNGDTVAKGSIHFFAHLPLSTQTYTIPTTLGSIPVNFSATVLFYEYDQLVCYLVYPTACTVGVRDVPANTQLKIFPTVVKNNITITLSELDNQHVRIAIYDSFGRLYKTLTTAENKTTIVLTDLKTGCYFIAAETATGRLTSKFIVVE